MNFARVPLRGCMDPSRTGSRIITCSRISPTLKFWCPSSFAQCSNPFCVDFWPVNFDTCGVSTFPAQRRHAYLLTARNFAHSLNFWRVSTFATRRTPDSSTFDACRLSCRRHVRGWRRWKQIWPASESLPRRCSSLKMRWCLCRYAYIYRHIYEYI